MHPLPGVGIVGKGVGQSSNGNGPVTGGFEIVTGPLSSQNLLLPFESPFLPRARLVTVFPFPLPVNPPFVLSAPIVPPPAPVYEIADLSGFSQTQLGLLAKPTPPVPGTKVPGMSAQSGRCESGLTMGGVYTQCGWLMPVAPATARAPALRNPGATPVTLVKKVVTVVRSLTSTFPLDGEPGPPSVG
jgi:hypothetical protein